MIIKIIFDPRDNLFLYIRSLISHASFNGYKKKEKQITFYMSVGISLNKSIDRKMSVPKLICTKQNIVIYSEHGQ